MSKMSLSVDPRFAKEPKGKVEPVGPPEPRSLVVLSEGARMLAEARTMDDLQQVRDLALAAAHYAKVRKLGQESQAYAVEIAAVASRRMAELDPPSKPWGGKKSAAGAANIPHQRRSENRDLLAFSEEEVRQKTRDLADPSLTRVRRLARDRRAANRPETPLPDQPASCDIRHGDFREVLADIEPVDVILTDPPYPSAFLPLWSDLGAFAKEKLKPGGLLVAMSGQLHLPEVFSRLSEHLPYRWTIAYVATGHATVVHARRIHSMWKPVLVYGGNSRRLYDLAKSDFAEKRDHEWGQSESGFADLLKLVADPGATICDPFVGGGTTAVVALRYGCSFVGAEIAEHHYRTSLERVAAA